MAIDLTGIGNENEFYTFHYLSAILENDLKGIFAKWNEDEKSKNIRPPYKRLSGLGKLWFSQRNRLERIKQPAERLTVQREFLPELAEILGYLLHPGLKYLDSGETITVLGEIRKSGGEPLLWILETVNPAGEDIDPLALTFDPCQFPDGKVPAGIADLPLVDIVSKHIFTQSEPPRWLLIVNHAGMLLLDRSKWNEKRFLRFDFAEILSRKETSTLQATVALLHRESICPDEGISLLDTLDENSHKHAFEVSEDLKYAAREAVEILGNEAVWYLRNVLKDKIYDTDIAPQLTRESLRYLYRLLFLFYLEARPELEYAPMKSDEYRTGYSLESLRDLELVHLSTEESRNGYYLHHSLQALFRLVYDGFNIEEKTGTLDFEGAPLHHTFRMVPLKSHLFDPNHTKLLNRIKFRNAPLQRVIELLSLSRPSNGRNNRRGRISYAQLGINQLGAVYEGLLSYTGFFAESDLYEVKKSGESPTPLDAAYFVKENDLPDYSDSEKIYNPDGSLRKHPKGSFIYRLAGRNRQKSASYYTPEVLTRCLVKYALKELLRDDMPANDILQLTVCEPAMGSGAFLNEAINQLADAYLQRKQKELGENLGPEDYARERQRVKMYIADNNVFGVDLNPIAVELAEVSLWLNCIYGEAKDGASRNTMFVPWFGMQLNTGNSLVGARRQVFSVEKIHNSGDWLTAIPERLMPGTTRQPHQIYHFLLPDGGMANYNDKVIKSMAAEQLDAMKKWRKEFCRPFSDSETKTLVRLCKAVDKLWQNHTEQQRNIRQRTTDSMRIFGDDSQKTDKPPTTTRDKDRILEQEFYSKNVGSSSAYRRLKLAMDYWCALWFWPIEQADALPDRETYLLEMMLLLEGSVTDIPEPDQQLSLFPNTMPRQLALQLVDELGFVNVERLTRENARLDQVQQLADSYRFFHWELEYADLFAVKGGFDLVLGNPPWVKIEWNEGGILGDYEPQFEIQKFSASRLAKLRVETIEKYGISGDYFAEFTDSEGMQNFLNASQNYPLLRGMQSNLYKCFLPKAWEVATPNGASAFLHPEGVYDDPKGGNFRAALYPRLRYHFQFQNELNLFGDVDHHMKFSINIFNNNNSFLQFNHISNLFAVPTIDMCFEVLGEKAIGGIKDNNNNWNTFGHPDRVIHIDDAALKLFAKLYDSQGTPALQARLPGVHSKQVMDVLRKFAAQPKRLGDLQGEYLSTEMWHETNAQKAGTIRRETRFPGHAGEWIVSGPHFYVGNPFNKTPRAECRLNSDYDVLDLTELPDDYLPRTNYLPECAPEVYRNRTPKVPWDDQKPVTAFYRLVNREMLSQAGERTLISCVIPKNIGHINTTLATVFKSYRIMLDYYSLSLSIPVDFRVKSTGMGHANTTLIIQLPVLTNEKFRENLHTRALLITSLTCYYSDLWQSCWQDAFREDRWTKTDPRLDNARFAALTPEWQRGCALRTDFERRQALVEIDVLAAMALGLTLAELCAIYRIQFPVLRQNENDTWYDQNGRIVFTCSKGLPGVGFSRTEWEEIKALQSGSVQRTVTDDTLPGGPRERTISYPAPFNKCDREADYATAWKAFAERLG